jgi:hypothetical protein
MGLRHPLPAGRVRPRLEEMEARLAPAVTVRFDYTYDTSGFFADADRRAVLERVGHGIGDRLTDSLAAVHPGGGNTWRASVWNPISNTQLSFENPAIGENEVVVYVGATDLPGDQLGLTTGGGFAAAGSRTWLTAVRTRGQAGAAAGGPKTDYSTWGGMITFDQEVNWSFSTTSAPAPHQFDFESVATHELLHVFGFGIGEPAFARHVTGWDGRTGQFAGPAVTALMGGPVGVTGDAGVPDHWASGTSYNGRASALSREIPAGTKRTVTDLEFAALSDIGWQVDVTPTATPAPTASLPATTVSTPAVPATAPAVATPVAVATPAPVPVPVSPPGEPAFVVGTPNGAVSVDATGRTVATYSPFGPGVDAVRVADPDLDRDGRPDLVACTGNGLSNRVAVQTSGGQRVEFSPFEASFTGGVNLAAGDLTGDGTPDLVVTPDEGGGPVVAVYDGAALARGQVSQVGRFWGINDPNFRGGARAAVGDINADGSADLVVAAGLGGGPRVSLYDGRSLSTGRLAQLTGDFFAFESGLRNGVYPTVADLDGDGYGDLVAGAGPGGGPRVKVFGGRDLSAGRVTVAADFFAGAPTSRGGVRLAAADVDRNGRMDLVTASGTPNSPVVVYPGERPGQASLVVSPPGDAPDGLFVG